MINLISNFFDNGIRIHSKSKTKVTIENRVLDQLAFFEHSINTYPFFKDYVIANEIWKFNDKDKAQHVLKIWEGYFAELRQRMASASDAFDGTNLSTSDFELVANFHTGEKVIYNSKERIVSDMHPNTFLSAMGKSQRAIYTETGVRVATFSFNPYNDFDRRLVKLEGQDIVEFNCFHAPAWRCPEGSTKVDRALEATYATIDPPSEFLEFMTHLFPHEDQRYYIYHWMYQAIFFRNETYLCLNGKKGAGKNYFVELMSHLIGRKYFKDMNQRIWDEGFNAVLNQARLIQLDELRIETDNHLNRLKKYINKDQNIEKKGVDADKLTETFNSFIINNNDVTDLRLKWDERRFSVPDLTNKRLEDVWDKEKIDRVYGMLTDLEFQRKVGFFIQRVGSVSPYNSFSVLRGEKFWKVVYNSLSEWERCIVDEITSGNHNEIDMDGLKSCYRQRDGSTKMFPMRIQKVRDFIEGYKHDGKDYLGHCEGNLGDFKIIVSNKYRLNKVDTSINPLAGNPLAAPLTITIPGMPSTASVNSVL